MLAHIFAARHSGQNAIHSNIQKYCVLTQVHPLDGFADQAKESIESAAGNVTDTARHASNENKSLFKKLFPVVALTLLAWLAYQFFTKPSAETGPPRSAITEQISPAVK